MNVRLTIPFIAAIALAQFVIQAQTPKAEPPRRSSYLHGPQIKSLFT
jgi:hypothetical protein